MRKGAPRRSYPLDFKLAVLEQTRVSGASVAVVARENGINANVVFGWRKLLREGRLIPGSAELTTLVPVVVTDPAASELTSPPSNAVADARVGGVIRLELARGGAQRLRGGSGTGALLEAFKALRIQGEALREFGLCGHAAS